MNAWGCDEISGLGLDVDTTDVFEFAPHASSASKPQVVSAAACGGSPSRGQDSEGLEGAAVSNVDIENYVAGIGAYPYVALRVMGLPSPNDVRVGSCVILAVLGRGNLLSWT